ncbi:MAG: hypothetical protein HOP18_09395 [Deltaproteobacteria bacterium]|nr:hypothetical protein [Deltaproteobacteria bacterium]
MNHAAASPFCSIRAATLGGEPLYGSAIRADRCVFISWPRPWWDTKTLWSRHFPDTARELIMKIRKSTKTRFFLFDPATRDLAHDRSLSVICMPCGAAHQVPLIDLTAALEAYETSCLCTTRQADEIIKSSVFVCTHSNRDQCCAKFGYGFAKQLRMITEASGAEVRVFETSHLGGDRFAGTAIAFPSGTMHGWLRLGDAASFAEALLTNRIHAKTYRGSIFLDRPAQVAEAFVRSELSPRFERTPIKSFHVEAPTDLEQRVSVEIAEREGISVFVDLVLRQQSYQTYSDCADLARGAAGEAKRWVVDRWSER